MKDELGGTTTVIGTGGFASLIAAASRTIQHVNLDLKLEGLRLAWVRGQREGK